MAKRQILNSYQLGEVDGKVVKSRGVAFLGLPKARKVRRKFRKELSTYNGQLTKDRFQSHNFFG